MILQPPKRNLWPLKSLCQPLPFFPVCQQQPPQPQQQQQRQQRRLPPQQRPSPQHQKQPLLNPLQQCRPLTLSPKQQPRARLCRLSQRRRTTRRSTSGTTARRGTSPRGSSWTTGWWMPGGKPSRKGGRQRPTLPESSSPPKRRAEQAYQARLGSFFFSPFLITLSALLFYILPFIVAKYTKDVQKKKK